MVDWGTVPQWATAGIALAAGIIAVFSIRTQRDIARKRAAYDLFLKTETDEKMIRAYDNFHKGIVAMKGASSVKDFCTSETTREEYLWVRKYLNIHELVGVGIDKKVLDHDFCYRYWGDVLMNNYSDAKPVLEFLRTREKNRYTYADLHKRNDKWVALNKKPTS